MTAPCVFLSVKKTGKVIYSEYFGLHPFGLQFRSCFFISFITARYMVVDLSGLVGKGVFSL
jgi:hypothetical protein